MFGLESYISYLEELQPYCLQHVNCWSTLDECPWCKDGSPPTPDTHIMGVKNEGRFIVYADGRIESLAEIYTLGDWKKDHPEWYPEVSK